MSMQLVSRVYDFTKINQKRAAPTSPKSPAMPKVETEEPMVAAFVLLGLLALAEDALEAVCELLIPEALIPE